MTRLQNDIVAFAQVNGIDAKLYDQAKDVFAQKRFIEGDKKAQFSTEKTFAEKEALLDKNIMENIARMSNVSLDELTKNPMMYASHPTVNWATFAIVNSVISAILPEALIDTVGIYSEIKVIGYGDSADFTVKPRDLFVVSKAGRGKRQAELHKQYDGTYTLVPENHEVSTYVNLYRVLAGLESIGDFMMKVARSIETALTYDIYDSFATAMAALPTSPATSALNIAGYSQDGLVGLAQKVTAWNQGRKAVIVGTQTALSKVLPANSNYRYTLDSDYVKIGYMQTAFGYDALCLPQVADYTTPFALRLHDDQIYVISPSSDKLVKVALGGDTISNVNSTFDNANLLQAGTIMKQWGVGVITNSVAGIITLQ